MRMVPQKVQQQQASAAAVVAASVPTSQLLTGLDMLKNLNFSQIGDAVAKFKTDPLTALEDLAEIALEAATIAGVPFAGTAEDFLPIAENMFNMANSVFHLFGGASSQAAQISVAISSPAGVSAPTTVTGAPATSRGR